MENEAGSSGRGKGRGRSQSRGRVLGRGRGHGVAQAAETELELVRQNVQTTMRALAKMPASVRAEYHARKIAKQVERILLPDAPARKRARNNSPERVPCRLVEGTPEVPPPPKPQPWQTQRVREEGGPHSPSTSCAPARPQSRQTQRVREEGGPHSPSTSKSSVPSPLMCDWTRGGLREPEGLNLFVVGQSRSSSPSSIPESASGVPVPYVPTNLLRKSVTAPQSGVLESPQQPTSATPTTSRTHDDPDQRIVQWLDELSDGSEEDSPIQPDFDIAEEPAHLPEDIDSDCADFLNLQDNHADQLLTELLTGQAMTDHGQDRTDHGQDRTDLGQDRTDNLTFDWTSDKDAFLGRRENFVGPSGPTFPLEMTDRPLDIFLKYFDDEIMDLIVSETNRNCDNLMRQTFSTHSRFNKLKGTDKSEIGIFLAVLVLQGLLPLPVEKDYFKENGYLTLKHFKSLMTYNRFILLKRLLHLTDNNDPSTIDNNKLRQLGPLLNLLVSKFKGLYLPSRDIAIDESLLKWLGRLNFAQKIATKAAKVGIKTYELCESSTGYCWNFFIYTGKGHTHDSDRQDRQDPDRDDTQDRQDDTLDRQDRQDDTLDRQDPDRLGDEPTVPTNLTAQIVLDLVRPLLNRGHTLVMDNFYNSPLLARYLKQNKTDCFGTLRVNREFVPEAIKKATKTMLRPGEVVQSYCRDLSVVLWRDSNIVAMLSTIHAGEVGGKEKYGHYKYKPQVVLDYNLAMGGVDKKDQLLSAHPMERLRNQAWYKKVFRRLLNVTILNSYIVYKTKHPRTSQRDFRTTLANELIAAFKPPQVERPLPVARVPQTVNCRRPILTGNHFVGEGRAKHLKCVECKKARTKYICKQCDVSLCLLICFEKFHT